MERDRLFTVQLNHLQEWQESFVDDDLTALNVKSLLGLEAYDHLLYGLPKTERRNDGRLRDKWLKKYRHTEAGGWWSSGLDPLNNWERMLWGRFKPDCPRTNGSKNKPIKYESPPKVSNRVTYFEIPNSIWDKVAKRYGIKRYHSPLALRLTARTKPLNFWEWVIQHPEIPIILTEGEKKAACLLSLGFVAIALPGIWNGRVGKDKDEILHPDLMPMAQKGRNFTILFDFETKPKTRYAIYQATLRTGATIEAAGCKCSVALLPGSEKGVDDFVVARGGDAQALLTKIIKDAISLQEYRRVCYPRKRGLSDKYPANLQANTRYLSDVLKFKEKGGTQLTTGTLVLDSGMGTGKTELMAQFRQAFPQMRFLNLGHRVNLLKNLSKRLKTEMYSDLSQRQLADAMGLSITVDSLYKLQHNLQEYDCIFIDEACQNLAHLLHSKTCKDHRAEILEVLEYIVRSAKLVVIADAHMNDLTVDFFLKMRPEGEIPFIVKNDYKQPGRPVHFYEGNNNSALVSNIFASLMLRQKIMVVSDSKQFIKKIEAAMSVKIMDKDTKAKEANSSENKLRVWSIHAENSGSEENVAFITDISESVNNIDVLLASPSLGTGVDITGDRFEKVFGVFHAVSQTATECAQSLHRNRRQVPLHIWVAPRPPFGYQETNAKKIKKRMLDSNEMTAFLIRIDKETGSRGAEKDWALDAYCQIEANRNRSINNLREDLRELLTEMAYDIQVADTAQDESAVQDLKEAAVSLDLAHTEAIVKANDITVAEYLSRQSQDYLKPEEIIECEKYRIHRDYGMAVTEELVKLDDGGQLIRKLIALEATVAPTEGELIDPQTGKKYPAPPEIVARKDLGERDNLPLCMDWHNYSSKWLARHILGIPKILSRLLEGEELCATNQDLVRMTEIAKQSRVHLKAILGFTVPADCKPLWLLGTLLDQLGLKLVNRKKGSAGQQVRYYSLNLDTLTFAIQVLEHRELQRQQKAEREQQRQLEHQQHQVKMQSQYSITPPPPNISTPPLKKDIYTLEAAVDMNKNQRRMGKILKFFQTFYEQFQEIVDPRLSSTRIRTIFADINTLTLTFKRQIWSS